MRPSLLVASVVDWLSTLGIQNRRKQQELLTQVLVSRGLEPNDTCRQLEHVLNASGPLLLPRRWLGVSLLFSRRVCSLATRTAPVDWIRFPRKCTKKKMAPEAERNIEMSSILFLLSHDSCLSIVSLLTNFFHRPWQPWKCKKNVTIETDFVPLLNKPIIANYLLI